MDNTNEIMVSVCCLVYNHEKYLREALDSFLMQKTNFKYEILIHDDASTDGSADIIREYEQKYPDIVKPIYQKENQYSKGVRISWKYQFPRAKGKYLAICEGDDFWCDENKLQIQFDAMENNTYCSMSTHSSKRVDIESVDVNKNIREIEGNYILDLNNYLNIMYNGYEWRMPFQTSSFFIRKKILNPIMKNRPDFINNTNIGDVPITLFALTKGNILYIDRVMSAYRINVEGSWTMRKLSKKMLSEQLKNRINLYRLFKVYYPAVDNTSISRIIYFYLSQYMDTSGDYNELRRNPGLREYLKEHNKIYTYYFKMLCSMFPQVACLRRFIRR